MERFNATHLFGIVSKGNLGKLRERCHRRDSRASLGSAVSCITRSRWPLTAAVVPSMESGFDKLLMGDKKVHTPQSHAQKHKHYFI